MKVNKQIINVHAAAAVHRIRGKDSIYFDDLETFIKFLWKDPQTKLWPLHFSLLILYVIQQFNRAKITHFWLRQELKKR